MLFPIHKKNLNSLSTHKLSSGEYSLIISYYQKFHLDPNFLNSEFYKKNIFIDKNKNSFGEFNFNIQFINSYFDDVILHTNLLNSNLKIQSYSKNNKFSNYYVCRKFGLQILKNLNNLRFIMFNKEILINGNFIVPNFGFSENEINFEIDSNRMLFRIFINSKDTNIEILLYKKTNEKIKLLNKNNNFDKSFVTLNEILENGKFLIKIIFNGFKEKLFNNNIITKSNCKTFKMTIAFEKNHNYICPTNNKNYTSILILFFHFLNSL